MLDRHQFQDGLAARLRPVKEQAHFLTGASIDTSSSEAEKLSPLESHACTAANNVRLLVDAQRTADGSIEHAHGWFL
jgi:hypothetical protein